ncbi:MAG: M48 family metalloprotease [Gammaproteobacteria bacterium]
MQNPLAITCLAALMGIGIASAASTPTQNLPKIGTAGGGLISPREEYIIGRQIVSQIRKSGGILLDPLLTEYIKELGFSLSAPANPDGAPFDFFIVRDRAVNAFALPGGFIGVNYGLFLETESESELAGVMAHEVAHVTQRHVARRVEAQKGLGLKALATMLGAILIGLSGAGADATGAAISLAQGSAIQDQLDYTRENEYESDRVGMSILYEAGYSPEGMISFFEKMQARTRLYGDFVPEYLSSHPLSLSRISEARTRARELPVMPYRVNRSYPYMYARLRALTGDLESQLLDYFQGTDKITNPDARLYGTAVTFNRFRKFEHSIPVLRDLISRHDDIIAFRIDLGEALASSDRLGQAIRVYEEAIRLFPRNIPLTLSYANTLARGNRPKRAEELIVDMITNQKVQPENYRLLAFIASEADNEGDSHFYMSEYYLMLNEPFLAIDQLKLALKVKGLTSLQQARYNARLEELEKELMSSKGRRHQSRQ